MTYSSEITRQYPTCFVFLLDQSGSMADPFGGGESKRTKSEGVSDAINKLLQNLVIKCARDTGIHDYLHVAVIGYGASVGSAWAGTLAGRDLVPISEIGNSPARIEERAKKTDDGAGGLVEQRVKFPVWFDPVASGGTPMCKAIEHANSILTGWISSHPNGYPPIAINITDGESTDGDPSAMADTLKGMHSSDGNVLLFNSHLSSSTGSPISFPDDEAELPDQHSKLLFHMSSIMPPKMTAQARAEGFTVTEASRGYVFNADLVSLITFLDIGTRASNLR